MVAAVCALLATGCITQPSDFTPPVLTLPGDLGVTAPDTAGASISWTATAVDGVDGPVPVTCTPPQGLFPVGSTLVTCTASDAAGNSASGSFTVDVAPPPPGGPVAQIVASGNHTCALLNDHHVWCWGYGGYGALGIENYGDKDLPVEVAGLTDAVQISAHPAGGHTCAVRSTGEIVCWGLNIFGQLGDGTTTNGFTPQAVVGISNATRVFAGVLHTCAQLDDDTARCWGLNGVGQLGDGTTTDSAVPVPVLVAPSLGSPAVNATTNCSLGADAAVRCWGSNQHGELGTGSTDSESLLPVDVTDLTDAVSLSAGYFHSCAAITDGSVKCWGYNEEGQLGDNAGGVGVVSRVPVAVSGITDATEVALGNHHSCALRSGGTVSCWGRGNSGQLGNDDVTNSSTPVDVQGLTGVASVSGGNAHTCAVTVSGTAWCWGSDANGQLGDGPSPQTALVPVQVQGLS